MEVQEYLDKCRAKGLSDEDIRSELLGGGWTKEQVDFVLKSNTIKSYPNQIAKITPKKTNVKLKAFIITLVIILILGATTFYFIKPSNVEPFLKGSLGQTTTSPIGLWSVETFYSYDPATQEFSQAPIDFSIYPGGKLYMEYTSDGNWCSRWDESLNCTKYEAYTISDNIITQTQEGLTGPQMHYLWQVNNGKLELTGESLDSSSGTWTPFLRYVLNRVTP